MAILEQLWEGKYIYLKNGQQYSEENFSINREDARNPNYIFKSEILSRVSSGEFLKIYVEYTINQQFEPVRVNIKRSLGPRDSEERYEVNLTERKLSYDFITKDSTNFLEIMPNGRFQIATPAFASSLVMTLSRKVDPVHRTGYSLICSDNVWSFGKRLYEKNVYLEQVTTSMQEIKIGKNELTANCYHMFQYDKSMAIKEEGAPYYLSKHFNLPYKAEFPDGITIQVERLKNTESRYNKMF